MACGAPCILGKRSSALSKQPVGSRLRTGGAELRPETCRAPCPLRPPVQWEQQMDKSVPEGTFLSALPPT